MVGRRSLLIIDIILHDWRPPHDLLSEFAYTELPLRLLAGLRGGLGATTSDIITTSSGDRNGSGTCTSVSETLDADLVCDALRLSLNVS